MVANILKLTNQFKKLAGLLKTPQEALDYITSTSLEEVCGIVLGLIQKEEAKKTKRSFDKLKELVNKYSSTPKPLPSNSVKSFYVNIDFTSTGYFKNIPQEKNLGMMIDVELIFSEKIRANIHPDLKSWNGLWYNRTIYVYVGHLDSFLFSNPMYFTDKINDIKDTIKHELQHAVQEYISVVRNMEYEKSGTPSIKNKTKNQDIYALRDIEFYPLLQDNISIFSRTIDELITRMNKIKVPAKIQTKIKLMFFNSWVNQKSAEEFITKIKQFIDILYLNNPEKFAVIEEGDDIYSTTILPDRIVDQLNHNEFDGKDDGFFVVLKNKDAEKYKKAIKEFYKSVADKLV